MEPVIERLNILTALIPKVIRNRTKKTKKIFV